MEHRSSLHVLQQLYSMCLFLGYSPKAATAHGGRISHHCDVNIMEDMKNVRILKIRAEKKENNTLPIRHQGFIKETINLLTNWNKQEMGTTMLINVKVHLLCFFF